jgi:hypothetical protein
VPGCCSSYVPFPSVVVPIGGCTILPVSGNDYGKSRKGGEEKMKMRRKKMTPICDLDIVDLVYSCSHVKGNLLSPPYTSQVIHTQWLKSSTFRTISEK